MPCQNSSWDGHLNRCLKNGLGSSFAGKNNQRNLVKSGTKLAHKNFGTSSSKTSSDQLYNKKGNSIHFLSTQQLWHNTQGHFGIFFVLGITITTKYLSSLINVQLDQKSRQQKDSSESNLYPIIFFRIFQILDTPVRALCITPATKF